MAILQVLGLSKFFGGLTAIKDLDLEVRDREILGIIGPNGAGKTTLLNIISAIFPPSKGKILYKNKRIDGLRPHQIAAKGIARTFQQTVLFQGATALWNVESGFHLQRKVGFLPTLLKTTDYENEEEKIRGNAKELLNFMGMEKDKDMLAKNLPFGQQRVLGLCIALAAKPDLLLLDEPAAGLNREEALRMMAQVRAIRDQGMTIMLVEHDMKVVMGLCDRIVVLNYGQRLAEGSPKEIKQNDAVIEAYLGRAEGP
jgi:branched-chain amino acid transport system ATP-binding protein